jgi:CRISPR-associated protein Csd1
MILQRLWEYYHRLAENDPTSVAPLGYSWQPISFVVVLSADGNDFTVEHIGKESKGRREPEIRQVFGNGGRSGPTPKPFFLWDNPLYVFGIPPKDRSPSWANERFEAFREYHIGIAEELSEPALLALATFLNKWATGGRELDPEMLGTHSGIFRIQGEMEFLHEKPAVREWWENQLENSIESRETGQCLITGEIGPIAKIHEPRVGSNIDGARPSAKLVSVNTPFKAGNSYGKTHCYNSPVSVKASFEYSTALTRLARHGNSQRIKIGDATCVFWTDGYSRAEKLFGRILEHSEPEDDGKKAELYAVLSKISKGRFPGELGKPETPFYILGLSPNKARISVRFWHESSLGELIERLYQHFSDLEALSSEAALFMRKAQRASDESRERDSVRDSTPAYPPDIRDLLNETIPTKKGFPDVEKTSPLLAGSLLNSILANTTYPAPLWLAVLNRIRIDGLIDPEKRIEWRSARHRRVQLIKACLTRYLRATNQRKDDTMEIYLNKAHPEPAYQCGRLMAVLNFVQEVALGKVNASVARRFLSAVSTSPAAHIGRLQVRAEVGHLPKLKGNLPDFLRDELKAINGQLRDAIPKKLNHVGQSFFVLGFYHELADLESKCAGSAENGISAGWR